MWRRIDDTPRLLIVALIQVQRADIVGDRSRLQTSEPRHNVQQYRPLERVDPAPSPHEVVGARCNEQLEHAVPGDKVEPVIAGDVLTGLRILSGVVYVHYGPAGRGVFSEQLDYVGELVYLAVPVA